MLALRRNLPRACLRLSGVRGNATLEASATPSEAVSTPPPPPPAPAATPAPSPPPAATKTDAAPAESAVQTRGRQRRGQWPSVRPSISLQRPREWNRPLAPGVLPAYDLALEYIQEDSKNLKRELEELREKIKAAESLPEGEQDAEALRKLRKKADILEIQSEINLPDVRWKARNGMGQFSLYPLALQRLNIRQRTSTSSCTATSSSSDGERKAPWTYWYVRFCRDVSFHELDLTLPCHADGTYSPDEGCS